jgi:ribosomal protein S12 methylthiotransferase accessory factor
MTPFTIRHLEYGFVDIGRQIMHPEDVCRAAEPVMEEIGVTEVVDITHLDHLDIPVWAAIRPRSPPGSKPVHTGAGITPAHARSSAMMEAIERFSGEFRAHFLNIASYEQVGLTRAVDPHDLILPRELDIGEQLQWCTAWDLLNETECEVPANAVYYPYDPMSMAAQLFRSDANGLAAGPEPEVGLLQGMLEVIENDAMSIAHQNGSYPVRLTLTQDGQAAALCETLEAEGIEVHLWLIPGKTGIPTVAAAADDTVARDPFMVVTGSAADPDPEVAAAKAILRCVCNRAGHLHAQESGVIKTRHGMIEKAGYERYKRINRIWFAEGDEVSITDVPDLSSGYVDEDIRTLLEAVTPHTDRVCAVDLTKTALPASRVIIPGFEVSYLDPSRTKSNAPNPYTERYY